MNSRLGRSDAILLTLLTGLAAVLRFYRLDTGLWFDEILTLTDSVRQPLSSIVTHFPGDNAHPLYSVLAHMSVGALGDTPTALRLPAALFGIAAIPLLYVFALRVTDRVEAGAAAAILTVSYHHIWFSQNARAYTLLVFCVLASTYALLRWCDDGRRLHLVTFAATTAVGAYAHVSMVVVCIGQALAVAVSLRRERQNSRLDAEWKTLASAFAGAAALTVLLYAPMLASVSRLVEADPSFSIKAATPAGAIVAAVQGLQVGFGGLWAIALGGIIFSVGIVSYFRERRLVALLFVIPLALTVLSAIVLGRPIRPRFVFFAIGFGLLTAVRGGSRLGDLLGGHLLPRQQARHVMVALVLIGAIGLSIRSLPYGYRFPKQDYEAAVTFIDRTRPVSEEAAVIGQTGEVPVVRYLGRRWQRVDSAEELDALRGVSTVWVLYTFASYIEEGQPALWTMLNNDCVLVAEFEGTVADGSIIVRRCP